MGNPLGRRHDMPGHGRHIDEHGKRAHGAWAFATLEINNRVAARHVDEHALDQIEGGDTRLHERPWRPPRHHRGERRSSGLGGHHHETREGLRVEAYSLNTQEFGSRNCPLHAADSLHRAGENLQERTR